jgi:hypothetical protein
MMTHGLFLYARVELSYAFLRMTMEIQYSPSLILLSIAVAIFASYVALNFAQTVSKAKGKAQIFWLAGGALAMGIGVCILLACWPLKCQVWKWLMTFH